MEDENQYKEVCDLLKIWFYFRTNNTVWPGAVKALEGRINLLTKDSDQ